MARCQCGPGAAQRDLRAARGIEVARGERRPPVAELDEAGAVAIERGGRPPPGQLGSDVRRDDLGLGLGEHPGLGQELPARQRDGGDIADRVHTFGAGRQRRGIDGQVPGLARDAAGHGCVGRAVRRYAEQNVIVGPLPAGQDQLPRLRVDPVDVLARVEPDAALGEHAGEGVAKDGSGGGHRERLRGVHVYGHLVPQPASPQQRLGQERGLVRCRRALER